MGEAFDHGFGLCVRHDDEVMAVRFGDRWRLWSRHRRRCGSGVCVLTEVVWSIAWVGRIVLADGEVACVFGLAEMAPITHKGVACWIVVRGFRDTLSVDEAELGLFLGEPHRRRYFLAACWYCAPGQTILFCVGVRVRGVALGACTGEMVGRLAHVARLGLTWGCVGRGRWCRLGVRRHEFAHAVGTS